jgi:hypothetical protein
MRNCLAIGSTSFAAALLLTVGTASAQAPQARGASGLTLDQTVTQTGPASVARAAPDTVDATKLETVGPHLNPNNLPFRQVVVSAQDGAIPDGITPLRRTIYTSKDFYADKDLWMDKRYYQCASPSAVEGLWGAYETQSTGDNPPATIPWGYCDRDYPRKAIVSPYPYKTAQEQYRVLLAEARSHGGPTLYTHDNPAPDWNGVYQMSGFKQPPFIGWLGGSSIQIPTYLSLLTPEYQQRFVQQEYHYGHDRADAWSGAYCWPDGFMRRFLTGFDRWVQVSPEFVSMWTDDSETLMTHVNVGRDFKTDGPVPRLGEDIRRWFGETIGFWDGDILVTWTSNIRGWISHGWFEFSNKMQSIEIYTPITDKDGKFVGINHEVILYDDDALAEPVRFFENWEKARGLAAGNPFDWRECVQDLYPINGRQTRVKPGDKIEVTVPYLYGRPWADIWVEYFEKGMQPPKTNDPLAQFE